MLVVNFFGGPGIGKSTMATDTFCRLKRLKVNCEYVPEEAKDFTWEKRKMTLECQPYIFAKQMRNLWRLKDQVDVVVTDSPLLLSLVYGGDIWPPSFYTYVADQFNQFNNCNFLLSRLCYIYDTNGRNEQLAEALEIDRKIEQVLIDNQCSYYTMVPTAQKTSFICNIVLDFLPEKRLTKMEVGV